MIKEKVIVLITEGDTDFIFYKNLLSYLKDKNGRPKAYIENINIKGVGKFASKAPAKYKNEISKKHPSLAHHVFLAYDSDVFELKQKPPVDWRKVEEKLKAEGALTITHLKAVRMIEDWFIFDINGICKSLGIKVPKNIRGSTGLEKIKRLFRVGHRIYQKGYNSNNFIGTLDIDKIHTKISKIIEPLTEKLYDQK